MLFKAEIENNEEIVREELIAFNSAIKDKKINSFSIDDGENFLSVDLINCSIKVIDSETQGDLDLGLSESDLTELKLFGLKPIIFRRVSISKSTSGPDSRIEKYFFGFSGNINGEVIYRLCSIDDGKFVLHKTK